MPIRDDGLRLLARFLDSPTDFGSFMVQREAMICLQCGPPYIPQMHERLVSRSDWVFNILWTARLGHARFVGVGPRSGTARPGGHERPICGHPLFVEELP